MQRLHLHGIGHELAEDLPEERVKDEVRITEEDASAKAYRSEILVLGCHIAKPSTIAKWDPELRARGEQHVAH